MESRTRSQFNFLIEGITLLVLMLMIATGLIMKFRLPPGSGGEGAALHGGQGRPLLTLAGLSRHQWGAVHFYLASAMLLLLVVHLQLHWRWVWGLAQGADPGRRKARGRTFLIVSILFLALAGLPWLVPLRGNESLGRGRSTLSDVQGAMPGKGGVSSAIYGAMTLNEVAQDTGSSLSEVAECLGVQGPVSGEERLGPLMRRLGLSMAEARARIMGLSKPHED
jgi:hypothetical protein